MLGSPFFGSPHIHMGQNAALDKGPLSRQSRVLGQHLFLLGTSFILIK